MSKVRRYFVTGLLITLPVFFTLYFFFIIFRFIDGICGKVINIFLIKHFGFGIPGCITGTVDGSAGRFYRDKFFREKAIPVIEAWFLKLPLIRQVYPAAKQVVSSIISRESRAFKKVVMVEYPSKGIWSIGFVTNDSFKEAEKAVGEELLHVFIATSPSPLTGYLVLMPKSVVKDLNISVEQGLKLIVSGGIIKPL